MLTQTKKSNRVKPLITITERAARHLRDVLATRSKSLDQRLRLVAVPGGQAGLVLDRAREEDKVIDIGGSPVLLLNPALVPVVEGATLDYAETSEGRQLTLIKERQSNARS